jgi:hypothetical protein
VVNASEITHGVKLYCSCVCYRQGYDLMSFYKFRRDPRYKDQMTGTAVCNLIVILIAMQ